jgi:hypothetical protein
MALADLETSAVLPKLLIFPHWAEAAKPTPQSGPA